MNDKSSIINRRSLITDESITGLLSPEITSEVKSVSDLWILAKMAGDIIGDEIWEVLNQLGCNPIPFDKYGYSFDYVGYNCLYFPISKDSCILRFAIPRISSTIILGNDISDIVNLANSLTVESKFTIMDNEVWLIYEHYYMADSNCRSIVLHILDNLRNGVEIFHSLEK